MNAFTNIDTSLDLKRIFTKDLFHQLKEVVVEKEKIDVFNDNKLAISELIKSLLGKEEEHIVAYIDSIVVGVKRYNDYYRNSYIKTYYNTDYEIHRGADRPAERVTLHDEGGPPKQERWYKNGKKHRDDNKPAVIFYDENFYDDFDKVVSRSWYKNGKGYVPEKL